MQLNSQLYRLPVFTVLSQCCTLFIKQSDPYRCTFDCVKENFGVCLLVYSCQVNNATAVPDIWCKCFTLYNKCKCFSNGRTLPSV